MKVNIVFAIISLLLSCLIGYALFIYSDNSYKVLLISGSTFVNFIYLMFLLSVSFSDARKAINTKIITGLIFLLNALLIIFFAFGNSSMHAFIMLTSLLFISFISTTAVINKK